MAQKVDVRYISFYTAGSAAQKIAPAIPLKTLRIPRLKSKKRIVLRIDPVAAAGIIMAAALMILLVVGVVQLQSARQEVAQLAAYVDTLQTENVALQAEYEMGFDPETVERTAIALGMIPMEEAQRISIQVDEIDPLKKTGGWEGFLTFLTGLFA